MRFRTGLGSFIVGALLLITSASAGATVITFEGASGTANTLGGFIDVSGFRFILSATPSASFETVTNQANIVEPGTTKLFSANHSEITMTRVGGGAFDLVSLDVGGSFTTSSNRWADHVDIIAGGNTLTVNLPSNNPTYQFASPNFPNVNSVLFEPFGHVGGDIVDFEFTLDNITVVTSAPEPTTLLLLAFGLTGLVGTVAWRRCRSTLRAR